MQTEELLTGVYGQLHELLGDHKAFKREMLDRLSTLEKEVKDAPGARTARLCAIISALSGAASLLGSLGLKLAASFGPLCGGAQALTEPTAATIVRTAARLAAGPLCGGAA